MTEHLVYTDNPEVDFRQLLSPELVDAVDELLTTSFSSGLDINDFFHSASEEVIHSYDLEPIDFFNKYDVVNSIFDEDKFDFMRSLYSFYSHVQKNTFDIESHQTTQSCPVCMEPYGSTKETCSCVFSRCGHHICYDCLHQDFSVRQQNSCVMCRQPIYKNHTSVYLHELLQFAHDLYLDFYELYHWPPQSALGRYFIRWLWAYIGAMSYDYWPYSTHYRWTKYGQFCLTS